MPRIPIGNAALGWMLGLALAAAQEGERPIWDYSLEDLMEMTVVTPSKTEEQIRDAPSVVSVVTWKEIEGYGANSLFDVLDRVTGLYLYGSYYLPNNMITIRGDATSSYCTHVLLLIDGRPFHASKEGYDLPFLQGFPLGVIDRIEIIRGPGSTLYGSTAYAGAINVITRKAEEQPTLAEASAGSFGTRQAALATGFRKGDLGFTIGTTFTSSEGWVRRVRDATADSLYPVFSAPAPERAFGIHTALTWKRARLAAFVGQHYMMNGYELQYVSGWPELNLGTTHATVDLGISQPIGDRWRLDANATWNHQHYWQPFDINAHDEREYAFSDDALLEIANHLDPLPNLHVTLGALTSYNTGFIDNNTLTSSGADYDVWTRPHNPDPFHVVPYYEETFVSGYANAAWSPFERVKLIAGAHANKAPDLDVDVVPRAGLILDLTRKLTWKVLYGEAFRSPDVFERFSTIPAIIGDSRLKPERIATLETQLAFARKDMTCGVTLFRSAQRNLITRRNLPDTGEAVRQAFVNEGEIESGGAELEGAGQIARYLSATASATLQANEIRNGISDPFGVPNLYAKCGLAYARAQGSAGFFVSRYDYLGQVAGYSVPFPDANPPAESFNYATLDLKANWKSLLGIRSTAPEITSEAYLVNLFDESIYYPEHGRRFVNSTPGRPGFSAYLGVKVSL